MKSFVAVLAVLAVFAVAQAQEIDECLKQDSISCIQKSLYRKAREFFDKDSFEIVTGVSLVRNEAGRASRSGKDLVAEQEVEQADGVSERQNAIESFVGEKVTGFFSGRSLRINFSPALEKIGESARAISESVPAEVREAVNEVVEGRGKKKILKKILPLLLLAKAKIGVLATLAYFGIALIAKKAILVSLVSIAISAFIGLRSLWAAKSGGHDTTGYSSGWASASGTSGGWAAPSAPSAGWSAGGSTGWDDGHAAHSQAYSGYHK